MGSDFTLGGGGGAEGHGDLGGDVDEGLGHILGQVDDLLGHADLEVVVGDEFVDALHGDGAEGFAALFLLQGQLLDVGGQRRVAGGWGAIATHDHHILFN